MCDPATIGLILTAAGAGTTAVNNSVSLRRQDRENARGIRRQGELQKEANNRVGEQIDDFAASDGSAERAQSLEGFQEALRASEAESVGGLDNVVNANQRFAEKVSQGRNQVATDANNRAGRLSVIDGATQQRMNEGSQRGRTVDDLLDVQRRSGAEDFITQLRIADRRPNEFVNALGSVLQGAGSAVSMGADGGILSGLFKKKAATNGLPALTGLSNSGVIDLGPFAEAAKRMRP